MTGLRFSGVTKRFPGVVALSNVSFDVAAGSVHAVCGENGAGKSTLGKILAGLEAPSSGTIALDGQPLEFDSPRDALAAGIAMVHQELAFCDNLSVGENLCLGKFRGARGSSTATRCAAALPSFSPRSARRSITTARWTR